MTKVWNFIGFVLAMVYVLSWTNILHPTYNFWGLMAYYAN